MTALPAVFTLSVEERTVRLYQEIMRVSRETAEQAYMLIEASLASANRQRYDFTLAEYCEHWDPASINELEE